MENKEMKYNNSLIFNVTGLFYSCLSYLAIASVVISQKIKDKITMNQWN